MTDTKDPIAAIDQVRHAAPSPGGTRVVWQQIGDGDVEATFVRDLGGGPDRALTANAHTAQSWGRVESTDRAVGTWLWSGDDYLGLVGPGDTLVAVHDAATGAALELPEHTEVLTASPEGFWLRLPSDPDETVAALWSPRDGELFTWYRQPSAYPFRRLPMIDGDDWYYLLLDQNLGNRGSWWRIDRTTGAWSKLLPILGVPFAELADGRLVTAIENDDSLMARLSVVDPQSGVYTNLAENISHGFAYAPGHGVYYLDAEGADMGLWFAPIPEGGARSGRVPGMRDGGREFARRDDPPRRRPR